MKRVEIQPQPDKAAAMPWLVGKRPTADDGDYFTIRDESGNLICEGRWTPSGKANAALIVRAVNEHAALVAVAENAENLCEAYGCECTDQHRKEGASCPMCLTRQALAQLAAVRSK